MRLNRISHLINTFQPTPRVFKPEATFDPTDPKFERRRKEGPAMMLDDPDFVESLRKK
jgi:hypothetical protein